MERLPGTSRAALAAVVTLCGIFLVTSFHRLNHTDLWGHLNFGRWIVQHGTLPASDPFRSRVAVESFLNVPWLSQVLGYAWHQALGLEGLVLGHAMLITLSAAGMMLAVQGRGGALPVAVSAAVATFLLGLPIAGTIRPQLFGMVAFPLVLWAITRLHRHGYPLLWLPVLLGCWANLHGSFIMGLVALGCAAVGLSLQSRQATGSLAGVLGDRRVRRMWAALALATAAACVNPCGVKLLGAVAGFAENTNLNVISEWRPMTVGSLSGGLFFVSVLLTAVLLRWSPRRITPTEIIFCIVFGLAAMTAIRMLVWWALVWPWLAAPHAAAAWRAYWRDKSLPQNGSHGTQPVGLDEDGIQPLGSENDQPQPRKTAGRTLLAAVIVLVALWWSPPVFGLISGHCRRAPDVLSPGTPRDLAEHIARRQLTGVIFAPVDWADYLLWRCSGTVEPMVYSHVHLSSVELWRDFLDLRNGSSDWLKLADRHGLKYLAIDRERNRKLAVLARSSPRCRVLYEDRQGLLVELTSAGSN